MILHILEAEVCGPHSLRLTFSDGTRKRVNLLPLLDGPIFEPLRDPAYFARVVIDPVAGTIVWPTKLTLRQKRCTSCRLKKSRPLRMYLSLTQ